MAIQNIQQNYLSPVEFRFVIERLPHVTFFTQGVSLPGVNVTPVEKGTPFKAIYFSGDRLTYDQFSVTFRVDENMKSYREIYDWVLGLSFPDSFDQHAALGRAENKFYSDGSLLVMSNGKNPNILYKFKDMFPISLSAIDMDTTVGDIQFVTATVTFQITSYEITTATS